MKADQKKLIQAYRAIWKAIDLLREYSDLSGKPSPERHKLVEAAWDVHALMDQETDILLRSEGHLV